MAEVIIGGIQASTITQVAGLKWSHTRKGGCAEASWEMGLGPDYINDTFRQGATVEIWDGTRIWKGLLAEPERGETWKMYARGLGSLAYKWLALDASAVPSSVPNTAIDEAITRGLAWTRGMSFSGSAFSSSSTTTDFNKIGALLDALMQEQTGAADWFVDADGVLSWAVDATTVTYRARWDGFSATADDDYRTHIYARYVTAVDATSGRATAWATATATDTAAADRWGPVEEGIDLTDLGVITGGRAGSIAAGYLAEMRARTQFADKIEFKVGDLRMMGDTPARLQHVRENQVVELLGATDSIGTTSPSFTTKFVIGSAEYDDDSGVLTVAPVMAAPRTLTDIIAATAPKPPKFKQRAT
jgi:hypothetical protein